MGNKRTRRTPPRSKLRPILLLVILIIAAVCFFFDQQNRIQIEKFSLSSPRLPTEFDGFTLVQLSDLHGKVFGEDNGTLFEKIAAQKPDIIAITGDVMDSPIQLEGLEALARGLVAIAPTYYVTGNHEWAARSAAEVKLRLEEGGVTTLSNDYVMLERGGAHIVLAGIDDPNGPYDQTTPQALADEIRGDLGDPYIVLLAHRNERYKQYDDCGFDLTLCGHAHGGMIRLPFVGGLLGNDRQFFPDHTEGFYQMENGQLIISRGLGNNTVPIPSFRLFNRPHLPVITLHVG